MEKSEKGNIEFLLKLTPLIPLITGIIISLGILKLFAFYIVFQINILHYITISESLLASLDFLILTFLILPIAIFIASFIPMSEKKVSKDESLISRLAEIDNSLKRKFFLYKKFKLIYGLLILALALGLWSAVAENASRVWIDFTFVCYLVVLIDILITQVSENARSKKINPIGANSIFWIIFLFLIFICSFTFIEINLKDAYEIKDNKWNFYTKLTYKDKSYLTTSDSIIYVGHQENFTFLYDKQIKQPIIISNSEILKIESIPMLKKEKK